MKIKNIESKVFQPGETAIKIHSLVQTPINLHCHKFDELVIVAKGKGVHFTEKEEYQINVGDVFFIKPGEYHGYRDTDKLEIINVLYFSEKAGLPLKNLKGSAGYRVLFELEPAMRKKEGFKSKLNLSLDELMKAESIVKKINEELKSDPPCGFFLAASYLMQLIAVLSRLYEKIPDTHSLPLMRLGNLLSYLENNYRKKISLDDLVKRFHISKSTLIRAFRKISGTTPLDYLLKIRIAKASELLKNPDVNITEAALSSGFSDTNYFSRQFKKNTGMSPRDFRKLYAKVS
ncbi:MAG: hypothetical protein A2017_02140 [Lentisphaerae bacterium GWF2_44_16]|nr:MAG: hypothetical protein A2017_02140 [Lentisphaerae bacterium GWF2_44_16]